MYKQVNLEFFNLVTELWNPLYVNINDKLILFRTPTGALIISMQSLAGESVRDRRRRERREIYELKLAEW